MSESEKRRMRAWADAIEVAMQNPKAYYWMGKWHREEAHMADDLPCNAPHDKQPLYAFPPDAAGELLRITEQLAERDAEIEQLTKVYEAARGLCHGYDWNKGSAALHNGYRAKLIVAVNAIKPLPDEHKVKNAQAALAGKEGRP